MADATLVIREGAGAGEQIPLHGELVLGREPGSSDLVLDDPGVSRRHAAVRALGGRITVTDLGSSNGTYVNGRRAAGEVQLADGDEIQLGGTVLTAHGAAPPTAPMAPRGAAPRRLAPRPDAGNENIPALAAVFLGPLSILLLLGSGAAFFVSLPCAIAAIVLGSIGVRKVDRGQSHSHRTLARIGRVTGIAGAILSTLALVAFLIVSVALDTATDGANGISDIVEAIQDEIEGVDVPTPPDTPNPPDAQLPHFSHAPDRSIRPECGLCI